MVKKSDVDQYIAQVNELMQEVSKLVKYREYVKYLYKLNSKLKIPEEMVFSGEDIKMLEEIKEGIK